MCKCAEGVTVKFHVLSLMAVRKLKPREPNGFNSVLLSRQKELAQIIQFNSVYGSWHASVTTRCIHTVLLLIVTISSCIVILSRDSVCCSIAMLQ